MESSKCFSAFITAVIYSFTIVLYTRIDLVKQYNFSDIALDTITKVSNKTINFVFKNKANSGFE